MTNTAKPWDGTPEDAARFDLLGTPEGARVAREPMTNTPDPTRNPMTEPDTTPPITLDDLKHLFDLAVDTPLVCSGSFDTDDVNVLRRVATMLGVDPNSITPDEFASQYPHPHKRRPVNTNPWPVSLYVDAAGVVHAEPGPGRKFRTRLETSEETAARNAEEWADDTCQVGVYGRRCAKLPDDPIHTPEAS
jgi:hypothetical protein